MPIVSLVSLIRCSEPVCMSDWASWYCIRTSFLPIIILQITKWRIFQIAIASRWRYDLDTIFIPFLFSNIIYPTTEIEICSPPPVWNVSWVDHSVHPFLCAYLNSSYYLKEKIVPWFYSFSPGLSVGITCWPISSSPDIGENPLSLIKVGGRGSCCSITVFWSLCFVARSHIPFKWH